MKVTKRVDFKSFHHKKRNSNCVVMDVNYTYCGAHLAIFTTTEYYVAHLKLIYYYNIIMTYNVIIYVNYISIKQCNILMGPHKNQKQTTEY